MWGGLSHALDPSWLSWRRVTHILCVLAKTLPDGTVATDWRASSRSRLRNIAYFDWCINKPSDRVRYLHLFTTLRAILEDSGTCLYIHCKNGRDRGAQTTYAFLRWAYQLNHEDCWNALRRRVDSHNKPLANINGMRPDAWQWLERCLRQE